MRTIKQCIDAVTVDAYGDDEVTGSWDLWCLLVATQKYEGDLDL